MALFRQCVKGLAGLFRVTMMVMRCRKTLSRMLTIPARTTSRVSSPPKMIMRISKLSESNDGRGTDEVLIALAKWCGGWPPINFNFLKPHNRPATLSIIRTPTQPPGARGRSLRPSTLRSKHRFRQRFRNGISREAWLRRRVESQVVLQFQGDEVMIHMILN